LWSLRTSTNLAGRRQLASIRGRTARPPSSDPPYRRCGAVAADKENCVSIIERRRDYGKSDVTYVACRTYRHCTSRQDPNLPKLNGREVLAITKEDNILKTFPTVVLTTSVTEVDIVNSYQLHANGYLTNPVQLDVFESLMKSINEFWLKKAKLPQRG
jgi:CheY-like chemotaxis protein